MNGVYHLLTGERPYEGNLTTIMHKVLYGSPPMPSRLSALATPGMDAIVTRAMARNPQDRFASAAEFNATLQDLLAPARRKIGPATGFLGRRTDPVRQFRNTASPFASRSPLFAALAAALVIAGGAGAWYFSTRPTAPKVVAVGKQVPDTATGSNAPVDSDHGKNGRDHATDNGSSTASTDPANLPAASRPPSTTDQPDRIAGPDNKLPNPWTNVAQPKPPEVTDPSALLPPPPIEPGPQRTPEINPPLNRKPLAGAGNARSGSAAGNAKPSSGIQAGAGRTNPDRRPAPTNGGTGRLLPDSTDHADLDLERRLPPSEDSSASTLLRLRADQFHRTNPGSATPAPAPLYSVYARTRKTEALNFSISAALSDSDFRVLA